MKINFKLNQAKIFLREAERGDAVSRRDTNVNSHQRSIKLPQLTLAKFSCEPLEWSKFWELFQSSVHERTDLPTPVKFKYLIGQFEDKAAKLLAGFNHSEAEYREAIDLLEKTYG